MTSPIEKIIIAEWNELDKQYIIRDPERATREHKNDPNVTHLKKLQHKVQQTEQNKQKNRHNEIKGTYINKWSN